ncbi:phosphoethanolamine transferase [Vibrio ponticus]|uniref:Phosphoethanolamine transferase n=1 Tax=Vibrio ponticus TaxID=265668 RepID=A0A3N3DXG6_9VIBR|nr:phosphoethanolamine transferase [Vibrio ponticus]ROV59069.1 phosphoethanolamine transferase [Vibrio ponticus]
MKYVVPTLKFISLVLLAFLITAALGYEVKVDSVILLSITLAWLKSSRFGFGVFVFLTIITACYIPVSWNYGHPNLTIVSSLLETNSSEAFEFFKDLEWMTLGAAILFAIVSMALFKFVPAISGRRVTVVSVLLFAFLLLDKPIRTINDRNISENYASALFANMRFAPVRFVFDWYDSYDKYYQYNQEIMAQKEVPATWVVTKRPEHASNTIIVLGESVRKDYMNAYGLPLANTPFMSRANGQLWTEFLSPGPNTFTSVMRYVTLNNGIDLELNNNINTLANNAGIETFWISNQGRMGEFDTGISAIANYAQHVSFTRSGSFRDSNVYDSTLLPSVEEALAANNQSKLIVVHLIGSHPRFCDRVEGDVEFNFNGDKISCYIESIRQTDSLLEKIDALAQAQSIPFNLLYVSDHGLAHRDSGHNLRHDPTTRQSYQVPLFITGSAFNSRELIDYPRNGFAMIKAISELMGVSTEQLSDVPSFFSPYRDEPIINNGEGELVPLEELSDDPIHS